MEPGFFFRQTYINQAKTCGTYMQDWIMLGIYDFRHEENLCITGAPRLGGVSPVQPCG